MFIRIENAGTLPSFEATQAAGKIATQLGIPVIVSILHRDVAIRPDECPHEVYRKAFPDLHSEIEE